MNPTTVRAAGLLGLAGALLMLAGDMLMYAHGPGGPEAPEGVRALLGIRAPILRATPGELILSGLTGPLAAVLYLIGVWHLFVRLDAAPALLRRLVTLAFASLFVLAGTYHALWSFHALVLQHASAEPAVASQLVDSAVRYTRAVYQTALALALVGGMPLLALVALGRTRYPRWTAALNPILLVLLAPLLLPAAERLPDPLGAMWVGGWFNSVFALFFAVSLATSGRQDEASPQAHGPAVPRREPTAALQD